MNRFEVADSARRGQLLRPGRFGKALALAVAGISITALSAGAAPGPIAVGSGGVTGAIAMGPPGIPYNGPRPGAGCVQVTHSVTNATSTVLFQTTDQPPDTIFRGDISINESGRSAPAWEDASGVYPTNACEGAAAPNNVATAAGTVSSVCASTVAGTCPVRAPAAAGSNFSCQWPSNAGNAGTYTRQGWQLTLTLRRGSCTKATNLGNGIFETRYFNPVSATVSGPITDHNVPPGTSIRQADMNSVPYTVLYR